MAPAALDRSRRYLVPVARLDLPGQPDVVHLSVYEWLDGFQEWATGIALCGYSTTQGALPDGTEVTCDNCLNYKPTYEVAFKRVEARQRAFGTDVPMTVEELRDTLGAIIHGHSRKDTTDWDLNVAMRAVEKHVAYRLNDFLAGRAQGQTPPVEGDQMT